jgi:hypothetical protein
MPSIDREKDGVRDLIMSPMPVELVGGIQDGTVVLPRFSLALHTFLRAFERLTALDWYAHGLGPADTDGPSISLKGLYQGMRSGSAC